MWQMIKDICGKFPMKKKVKYFPLRVIMKNMQDKSYISAILLYTVILRNRTLRNGYHHRK